MKLTYRCFVSGKVQGVGYRRFTQKQAQQQGLSGWTRNLNDGRVEVLAQGEEPSLKALVAKLQEGPAFSLVEAVSISEIPYNEINGFDIRPDADPGAAP